MTSSSPTGPSGAPPSVSVVVPAFNEEGNVAPLAEELLAALGKAGYDFEILFIDDGSTDGTAAALAALAAREPRVKVIAFRRNFGQTAAIAAGFDHARGDLIVTMDGDLQNDPADIPALVAEIARGADVVSGWRVRRQEPYWTRILPSRLANGLISWVCGVPLHDYGCTLKVYRREITRRMALYGEMHRFLPALASWVGARVAELPVHHRPRRSGVSKYTLARTFKVLLDLVTVKFLGSYSTKPIYFFGGCGFACYAGAALCVADLVFRKIVYGHYMIQSPILLLATLFAILGTQFILMGLLAEICIRVLYEAGKRDVYVVRDTRNLETAPPGSDTRAVTDSGAPAVP